MVYVIDFDSNLRRRSLGHVSGISAFALRPIHFCSANGDETNRNERSKPRGWANKLTLENICTAVSDSQRGEGGSTQGSFTSKEFKQNTNVTNDLNATSGIKVRKVRTSELTTTLE